MATTPGFDRRALLKAGLTVSAVSATGLLIPTTASAGARNTAGRQPVKQPEIFDTQEWGAREPNGTIVVEDHKPTYIVVHHTVDPGNSEDYTKEHALQISRDIQNFHMDNRGWIDTGQQFTNSRGGFVTEGRHRSLEIVQGGTQHVQGSNVGNHNSEVIGIENEGLYSDVDVPQALWDSLVRLVSYIASQYGLTPDAIKGHRDFNTTECPGQVLYDRLPELRKAVGDTLGIQPNETTEWPLLKPGDSGPKVATAQRLLRAKGANQVPVDGFFGPSTRDAVTTFTKENRIQQDSCCATAPNEEHGFLGSDIWPLITPAVAPGNNSEAARAATELMQSTGARISRSAPMTRQAWKDLLGS